MRAHNANVIPSEAKALHCIPRVVIPSEARDLQAADARSFASLRMTKNCDKVVRGESSMKEAA